MTNDDSKIFDTSAWAEWGKKLTPTPEQIITWLDAHRQFMWEVWRSNPSLYEEWKRLNNR